MVLPLLARGITGGLTKAATSKATQTAAKKFVSGKGKKKVKEKVESSTKKVGKTETEKTKTTPKTRKVSRVKIPSSVYKTGTKSSGDTTQTTGKTSFESISKQLDNINKTTQSLVSVGDAENKAKEDATRKLKDKKKRDKAQLREDKLEKKKGGGGLLSVGKKIGKNFGIFDFLTNIALGGLVLFLLNNYSKIENLFKTLSENFSNPFKLLKSVIQGITSVFAGPVKGIFKGTWNVLKKGGNVLKTVAKKSFNLSKNVFKSIGTGISNLAKRIVGQITGAGARGIAAGANGTTSAVAKATQKSAGKTTASQASTSLAKTSAKKASKRTATQVFGKGAKRLLKFSKIFKKVPVIGGLISIFIDLMLGEPLDRAIVGAIGGGIGAWIGGGIGSLVFPFAGTAAGAILGSMVGDWAGKALYEMLKKKIGMLGQPENLEGGLTDPQRKQKLAEQEAETQAALQPEPEEDPNDQRSAAYSERRQREALEAFHGSRSSGSGSATRGLSITGAHTTYYDPSLGGINASGYKTPEGLPATSTGEGYRPEVFSAAAFPPLLAKLPSHMTVPSSRMPGGRTLKKPFNIIVTNSQGKRAVIRVNDVGPGVAGHKSNHMLDFSVAAKNYLGTGGGFSIEMAGSNSRPGPLTETSSPSNQPSRSLSESQETQTTQQTPSQAQLAPQLPGTGTIKRQGATTGAQKGQSVSGFPVTSAYGPRWGTEHKGIDIGTPEGTYVALDVDVEIVFAGLHGSREGKGYGNVVDAWAPSLGLQFRLAHLNKILCRKGQKIPAGVPLGQTGGASGDRGRGSSTGPHLHFEVDRNKNGTVYGGSGDPSPYVGHLILSSTAPTGQATGQRATLLPGGGQQQRQVSGVQNYASYERAFGGGGVSVVPIPGQSPSGGGGGGGMAMVGGSTKDIVNSYYKSQLMGFLYKQG